MLEHLGCGLNMCKSTEVECLQMGVHPLVMAQARRHVASVFNKMLGLPQNMINTESLVINFLSQRGQNSALRQLMITSYQSTKYVSFELS